LPFDGAELPRLDLFGEVFARRALLAGGRLALGQLVIAVERRDPLPGVQLRAGQTQPILGAARLPFHHAHQVDGGCPALQAAGAGCELHGGMAPGFDGACARLGTGVSGVKQQRAQQGQRLRHPARPTQPSAGQPRSMAHPAVPLS
jgi:hypothetical protein